MNHSQTAKVIALFDLVNNGPANNSFESIFVASVKSAHVQFCAWTWTRILQTCTYRDDCKILPVCESINYWFIILADIETSDYLCSTGLLEHLEALWKPIRLHRRNLCFLLYWANVNTWSYQRHSLIWDARGEANDIRSPAYTDKLPDKSNEMQIRFMSDWDAIVYVCVCMCVENIDRDLNCI